MFWVLLEERKEAEKTVLDTLAVPESRTLGSQGFGVMENVHSQQEGPAQKELHTAHAASEVGHR